MPPAKRIRSARPVLEPQAGHAPEFTLVVGHEREIFGERMGRDPKIVRADGLPRALQKGTDVRIPARRVERQRQHLERLEKRREMGSRFLPPRAHDLAEGELAVGDHGDRGPGRALLQPSQQRRWAPLHHEDANVAIEQVAHGHSESLDGLRGSVRNVVRESVVRERRKLVEQLAQPCRLLAQHDVVSAAEYLHPLAAQSELLWQPHGLAIPRLEYSGDDRRVSVRRRRRFSNGAMFRSLRALFGPPGGHAASIYADVYTAARGGRIGNPNDAIPPLLSVRPRDISSRPRAP